MRKDLRFHRGEWSTAHLREEEFEPYGGSEGDRIAALQCGFITVRVWARVDEPKWRHLDDYMLTFEMWNKGHKDSEHLISSETILATDFADVLQLLALLKSGEMSAIVDPDDAPPEE